MVLKLYGHDSSTAVKRVTTVLNEKNVPFEYIFVDFSKGEHKAEPTVKNNPFGRLPWIDDNGFILYESRAICRYIATKYADQGTQLIPTDPKKAALMEQAIQIEATTFDTQAFPFLMEKVVKPMYPGGTTDEEVAAEHHRKLSEVLDVYETILSKQKYMGGDELTLADLYHLPIGAVLPRAGSDEMKKRPNVARWFDEINSRPAWLATAETVKSTAN